MAQADHPTQSVREPQATQQKPATVQYMTAVMPSREIGEEITGKFMGYFVCNDDIFALFKRKKGNKEVKYGVSTEVLKDFMVTSGLMSLSVGAPAYTLAQYGMNPIQNRRLSDNIRDILSLAQDLVIGSIRKDRRTILVQTKDDLIKTVPDLLPHLKKAHKELAHGKPASFAVHTLHMGS